MTPRQLRAAIEESGLSVRQMAKELEIHERTLHRYLSGEAVIPKVVAMAVAFAAFGIPVNKLMEKMHR